MKFNISQVKKIIKEEVDKLLKEKGDVLSLSDYFGVEDFTADDARELKSISSRIKQDVTDEHELRAINTIEKVVDELASRSTGSDEVESGDEELLAAGKINEIDEEDLSILEKEEDSSSVEEDNLEDYRRIIRLEDEIKILEDILFMEVQEIVGFFFEE